MESTGPGVFSFRHIGSGERHQKLEYPFCLLSDREAEGSGSFSMSLGVWGHSRNLGLWSYSKALCGPPHLPPHPSRGQQSRGVQGTRPKRQCECVVLGPQDPLGSSPRLQTDISSRRPQLLFANFLKLSSHRAECPRQSPDPAATPGSREQQLAHTTTWGHTHTQAHTSVSHRHTYPDRDVHT